MSCSAVQEVKCRVQCTAEESIRGHQSPAHYISGGDIGVIWQRCSGAAQSGDTHMDVIICVLKKKKKIKLKLKFRIRESLTLSTCADNIIVTQNNPKYLGPICNTSPNLRL